MADEAHTALTVCAARRHTRTWHAAFLASITCRMPMEKTAVLPVPDCDCTIRSRPRISGPMARACTALGRCKEEEEGEGGGKEASWREEAGRGGSGLARRPPPQGARHTATHCAPTHLKPVRENAAQEALLQAHGLESRAHRHLAALAVANALKDDARFVLICGCGSARPRAGAGARARRRRRRHAGQGAYAASSSRTRDDDAEAASRVARR